VSALVAARSAPPHTLFGTYSENKLKHPERHRPHWSTLPSSPLPAALRMRSNAGNRKSEREQGKGDSSHLLSSWLAALCLFGHF